MTLDRFNAFHRLAPVIAAKFGSAPLKPAAPGRPGDPEQRGAIDLWAGIDGGPDNHAVTASRAYPK